MQKFVPQKARTFIYEIFTANAKLYSLIKLSVEINFAKNIGCVMSVQQWDIFCDRIQYTIWLLHCLTNIYITDWCNSSFDFYFILHILHNKIEQLLHKFVLSLWEKRYFSQDLLGQSARARNISAFILRVK